MLLVATRQWQMMRYLHPGMDSFHKSIEQHQARNPWNGSTWNSGMKALTVSSFRQTVRFVCGRIVGLTFGNWLIAGLAFRNQGAVSARTTRRRLQKCDQKQQPMLAWEKTR